MPVQIKRVYETPQTHDGIRILVDRLWPRGVSHERAGLSAWEKDIAPSPELRTWWRHDPTRFADFAARYRHELETLPRAREAAERIVDLLRDDRTVTLVYAAKDPQVNHALVLAEYLDAAAFIPPGPGSGDDGS